MIEVRKYSVNHGTAVCIDYLYDGIEIAKYDGVDDLFAVNREVIGNDTSKSEYERAVNCPLKEAYIELFKMLGIEDGTDVAEYAYV